MKKALSLILALVLLIGLVPMNAFATNVETAGASTANLSEIDLFVFAGQSNMMGASVLEPQVDSFTDQSLEYKYMPKLRGEETGAFVSAQNSAGEWYYNDLDAAYGNHLNDLSYKSTLSNYSANTYNCGYVKKFAACKKEKYNTENYTNKVGTYSAVLEFSYFPFVSKCNCYSIVS